MLIMIEFIVGEVVRNSIIASMSQANRQIIGTRFSTQILILFRRVRACCSTVSQRRFSVVLINALSFAVFFSSYSFVTLSPLPLILAARAFPKAYQSWHVFFYACA